jgi:hypothetical protein
MTMTTPRGTDLGWYREFEEPIPLSNAMLATTSPSYLKAEHTAPRLRAFLGFARSV